MPLPPTDPSAVNPHADRPAWALVNSPLAMSVRVLASRRRTRVTVRERALRVAAISGAALIHILFLLVFVLGPPYEPEPPPDVPEQSLQVRLIDAPEPPPVPPAPAEVPKQVGPTHQGHASRAAPARQNVRSTYQVSTPAKSDTPATSAPVVPVVAKATTPSAPEAKPVAAPRPPASLPKPAPAPEIQPIPLAGEPPTIAVATPSLKPPMPPKLQPEPVRRPQLEGTVAMPPPASLALPPLPQQIPPPISVTSMAMTMDVPKSSAPVSVVVARPQLPAAPEVPQLQSIPLPAQAAPNVKLETQQLSKPAPATAHDLPQVQAPTIVVAEAQLEAVPVTPTAQAKITLPAQTIKIASADKTPIAPAAVQRPQLSASPAAKASPAESAESQPTESQPTGSQPAESAPAHAADNAATASAQAATDAAASGDEKNAEPDVSTAPNASAQGSDTAKLGASSGAPAASAANATSAGSPIAAAGSAQTKAGTGQKAGERGGQQAGAAQGEKQGGLGSYVQLKPTGDTAIMSHGTPGISYKPTRFEKDWTPEGESSIDTALRRAVEKTTLTHTFHLPRGIRVKCVVMPLLPMSLLGCGGADPPPKPVDSKVYDRLHLAPAKPLAPAAPAASSAAPAPMIKFDNAAQCAAARVAGSPPPPDCPDATLPPTKTLKPAAASSSWVPASDQFH